MFSPSHYFRQFGFQMNVVWSALHFCLQFYPKLHRWVHLSSNLISFWSSLDFLYSKSVFLWSCKIYFLFDHRWILNLISVWSSLDFYHFFCVDSQANAVDMEKMGKRILWMWGWIAVWERRNVEHKQYRDIEFWGFWGWYLRFWFFRFLRAVKLFSLSSWLATLFLHIGSSSQKVGQFAPLGFSEKIKFWILKIFSFATQSPGEHHNIDDDDDDEEDQRH